MSHQSNPNPPADARAQAMLERLRQAFAPTHLALRDDGHLHIGHAGAASGHGHYAVEIVSAAFEGQSPIARHRAVYAALGEMMHTDIHALSIRARTPAEAG